MLFCKMLRSNVKCFCWLKILLDEICSRKINLQMISLLLRSSKVMGCGQYENVKIYLKLSCFTLDTYDIVANLSSLMPIEFCHTL